MVVRKLFKKKKTYRDPPPPTTKPLEMDQISQVQPHVFKKRPKEKNLYSKQHGRHE